MKRTNQVETGRSMVEMLGVLAIMGVLSVGGISGYTTAMNKHKANEILNDAAMRAMSVSAQLQSGVDPATAVGSIASGEKVGDAELSGAQKVGDDKFKLVFTSGSDNVSEAVCKQMLNIAGTGGVVGIDSACERLLYHDDMSPGVDGSNTDTDPTNRTNPQNRDEYGECKEGLSGTDCDECTGTNKVYVSGECVDCTGGSSTTQTSVPAGIAGCYCPADKVWDETNGCTCAEGYEDNNGVCEEKIAGKPCQWANNTNNTQCGGKGSGYYCNLEGKVTKTGWTDDSCYTFSEGTCQATEDMLKSGTDNQTKTSVNWYTGYSFCQGLGTKGSGMSMVTGQSPSKITCSGRCTETISNHPSYYWLDMCYSDTTQSCSSEQICSAFYVSGGVAADIYARDTTGHSALCE